MENGTVFMQPLSAYLGLESRVVGDPDEGLFSRYSGEGASVRVTAKIDDEEIPLRIKALKIHGMERKHGVYCMCSFQPDAQGNLMPAIRETADDIRMHEFGDTLLVFRDTLEFVRRLDLAAKNAGLELERGPVEYVPTSYCGDMGPFRKLTPYSYQREWRFMTTAPIDKPLVLNLALRPAQAADSATWT